MTAKEYFKEKWGSSFHKATLHEDGGILELSMEDIYQTMEDFRAESNSRQEREGDI